MPPDELPVLDESQPRSLEVPARALGSRGGRASVVVVGGLAALVVLAGLANRSAGPIAAAGPAPSPSVAASIDGYGGPFGFARRPLAPTPAPRPEDVIDLRAPDLASPALTSDHVSVAGQMLVRAVRVDISLSANGYRLFGEQSIDVTDKDGGIRPDVFPTFDVDFRLSTPRPIGTMLVIVTAYGASGTLLAEIRRAIPVGPRAIEHLPKGS
jgi:hypothetical protein